MLGVGGAIAWSAAGLGIGRLSQPGPGFLGFYTGLVILLMGLAVVIGTLRSAEGPSLSDALRGMGNAPGMIVPMVLFCLVLEHVGYLVAAFLLMLWLFTLSFGTIRSPWPAIYAVIATGATWLLFDRLLGSELPPLPF